MAGEALIRLGVFLGLFAVLALAEQILPRRTRVQPRSRRWFANWGIIIADTLTLRLLALAVPALAVGAAIDAGARGWGLFNRLDWPAWAEFLVVLLLLDWLIWFQHVITHRIPLLWRLHRVHHADRDMDVTTAIRFHPIEIALSMLLKIGAVYLLGPSALAVLVFEILLNGCALFNHSNLAIPPRLERWLRLVLVTPDMHRVHHSDIRAEHDTNFGFSISLWDRIFRTYRAQPEAGHDGMTVGLEWQDDRPSRLGWALWLPFR